MQVVTQGSILHLRHVIDSAVQRGAADIELEVNGGVSCVHFTVRGRRRLYETLTANEGEALISAVPELACGVIEGPSRWAYGKILPTPDIAPEIVAVHSVNAPLHDNGKVLMLRLQYQGKRAARAHSDDLAHPKGPEGEKQFESLGFSAEQERALDGILGAREGLIVVTGPTGSGLTTTSYELLREIQRKEPGGRIVTVEPVPTAALPGVIQFAAGEHPKEMRDVAFNALGFAARTLFCDIDGCGDWAAIEAALVHAMCGGRSIVATYSSSVPAVVGQLTKRMAEGLDGKSMIGEPKDLVASMLKGIINQRMVTGLCPQCAIPLAKSTFGQESGSAEERVLEILAMSGSLDRVKVSGAGCAKCEGRGHGRSTMLAEVLTAEDVSAVMAGRRTASKTMVQRVVDLVLSGRADPIAAHAAVDIEP